MPETMQFDLVSPERSLASCRARAVRLRGMDGDMTVMPDHAPVITTLRPGMVEIEGEGGDGGSERYVVTGGFAEIGPEGVSVLAEKAMSASEATRGDIEALVAEARERAAGKEIDGARADEAALRLADLEALAAAVPTGS